MNWLYRWLVLAFRAAVRAEVEAYMRDRREALRRDPDPVELRRLRARLEGLSLTVVEPHDLASADILPFPSVQPNHSEPPPSAA